MSKNNYALYWRHDATQRRSKQTQFSTCMTGVNPKRTHGFGCYKGERVVWGVRVDSKLLKRAKPILRAEWGSDCRAVEAWLAGLVAVEQGNISNGVNPRHTVEIGKLVIERNLRSRRKMVIEEEVVEETKIKKESCHMERCPNPVTYVCEWTPTGTLYACCRVHAEGHVRGNPIHWKLRDGLEVSK